MARPRRLGTVLAIAFVLVVAGVAWVGWTAYQVNRSLGMVVDDAEAVRAAVEGADADGARAALTDLQDSSQDADDRTSGPTWRTLGVLPFIGDDADGIALASEVIADLGNGGVEPLIATAEDLDSIVPRDSRVDLGALERLRRPVAAADVAFTTARDRLSEAEPDGYVDRLAVEFRDLRAKVADAQQAMSAAATALEVLPSMLGSDGPRDFLLVMQNNAEVRATGGLPGAISVVHTEAGRIALTRQIAASALGKRDPALPTTAEERAVYSSNLGIWPGDPTLIADWPRASELIRGHWEVSQPETPAGVLSIDPVTLSYLLEVTGPVEVEGVELRADNVVDELLHDLLRRVPDAAAQDAFYRAAAKTVFDRVSSGVERPQDMLRALSRAAREGRLLVHSFDTQEQEVLDGTAVSGRLPDEMTPHPQVGAYLNDTSAAKMSYFLRHRLDAAATSCAAGRQRLTGHLRLESVADPAVVDRLPDLITGGGSYGVPVGSQLVVAHLYGPVGGTIDTVTFNGRKLDVGKLEHENRPVTEVVAQLEPGEVTDVEWTMTTAEGQTGDVEARTTPSIAAVASASTSPSACG
jgi:hypothetical protein